MNVAREIAQMNEAQCIEQLSTFAQPGSQMWFGLTARVQQLRSEKLSEQTERLEKQVVELVGIAAEQKRIALLLDGMTRKLVGLTVWLKWLTIALVFLTCVLCFLELGGRQLLSKLGLNSAEGAPHIQKPVDDERSGVIHERSGVISPHLTFDVAAHLRFAGHHGSVIEDCSLGNLASHHKPRD